MSPYIYINNVNLTNDNRLKNVLIIENGLSSCGRRTVSGTKNRMPLQRGRQGLSMLSAGSETVLNSFDKKSKKVL